MRDVLRPQHWLAAERCSNRLAKRLNFDPVPGILSMPNMETARQD